MLLNSIVPVFCIATVFFFSSCSNYRSYCGNTVLQEVMNVTNRHKIVVFERDCGASTGTSIQISVLKSSENLPNDGGNIFVSNWVKLETNWIDDSTIIVKMPEGKIEIFKKDTMIERVRVKYEIYKMMP